MYKNQYFICDNPVKIKWDDYDTKLFNGFHIYHSTFLDVTIVEDINSQLCTLGYIIDPFSPQKNNEQILEDLLKTCSNADELIINLQKYSGRYVVLYKNDRDFIMISDACSLRQIYYTFFDGQAIFTSSPKMFLDVFDYKWLIGDLKKSVIDEKKFAEKEFMYGDEGLDDRLMKVLPNHYLNMTKREVLRTPLKIGHFDCEDDVINYASDILRGSIAAINNRYKTVQAITAGLDSRTLLAASKSVSDSIEYYTFSTALTEKSTDYIIPGKLANSLKIKNYKSILPGEVNQEFREFYSNHHIFPRINHTLRNIQYHYYNNQNKINVNGNGGEIVRNYYGNIKINDVSDLYCIFDIPENRYVMAQIDKWYRDAKGFSEEYSIPITDLFYWENRMGNWFALAPLEQDIAIEMFCPFNNKELLLAIFTIDSSRRSAPNYTFFKDLIYNMWSETLTQPINPENIIKRLITKMKIEIKKRMNDRTISLLRKVIKHCPFWPLENIEKRI
ncbi:MAG: hypothetical protein P4L59_00255 [Desulfosporosinus sp.]|nr:hypothetical protein [Desulfosporosinus sp.]